MIEKLEKDKRTGRVSLLMKKTTPAFVNALRRTIMDTVPTMAIEEIEYAQNTSALYDEMLANRLGLIPITTDLKGYELPESCKCAGEGCARCQVKLTLKAKGPKTVYSGDMESKDPKVKPAIDSIPIVKLLKGQELTLTATAQLGRGKNHVKHAAGLVWYTYKPSLKVNNNHPDIEAYESKYPPQIFKNGKIDSKIIEEQNLYEAVEGVNNDIINVERDNTQFIINIEPWGQLSPADMLGRAADELIAQFEDFAKSL